MANSLSRRPLLAGHRHAIPLPFSGLPAHLPKPANRKSAQSVLSQHLRSSASTEEIPESNIPELFKLPLEIREMIYTQYFIAISKHEQNFYPESPGLLAAVGRQSKLYVEVIKVHRQEYNFMLRYKNQVDFDKNVSMELIRSIQHLTIGCEGMETVA
jgi:hypothetical protein